MQEIKSLLSPKDLATAIGVSESSIKRWVDEGRIRATKTAGGHRRIAASEAIRFIRASRATLVEPAALGLADLDKLTNRSSTQHTELLYQFLLDGQAEAARGVVVASYLGGRSVAQIVDGPLRTAMQKLGELWRDEDCGIYWEHRATEIAISAISRLRLLIPSRPEDAPVAVGGAPSSDPYFLPTLCAAAVLDALGFNAVNLGPDTPIRSLLLAREALQARLIWLSVSASQPSEQLHEMARTLLDAVRDHEVPVIIGGEGAHSLHAPDHHLLHVGSSMAELEALVKGLRISSPPSLGS